MDEIHVRKATMDDLPIIQVLCNALSEQSHGFDDELNITWASEDEGITYYKECISGENGSCFVAEKEGELVGFVSTSIHEAESWRPIKRVEVDNLFVAEQHRGGGVGKLLIEAIKVWGKEIGAKRVSLTAYIQNEKAIAFYKREGFLPYELTLEFKE